MLNTSSLVFRVGAALGGDIYHFHDPEGLLFALKWQKKLDRPFLYDVHEDYRLDIRGKTWIPRPIRHIAAWRFGVREDSVSKRLAGVVAATESIAERFSANSNVAVVKNYPLLDELRIDRKASTKSNAMVYVGVISPVRSIRETVLAFDMTKSKARLNLGGCFSPPSFRNECAVLPGWKQINELGFIDRAHIRKIMSESVAGLVLTHPIPQYMVSLPIKMFEYMAAGLPVIAADFPLWRKIIAGNDCGLLVNPESIREIAAAIDHLVERPDTAEAMGRRGREAVESEFNWETEYAKLLSCYDKIVKS